MSKMKRKSFRREKLSILLGLGGGCTGGGGGKGEQRQEF
jgi:hypothetical protein